MLIPTVLMFSIYVFIYWGNMEKFSYCVSGEYKFGYWFTFVLFLMNLLHWGTSWILNCSKKISDAINVIALICITILLVLLKDWDWNHNEALLRNCFEFLQKVFLGLMYSFSCVLWAIFWSFPLLFFVR